MRRFLCLLAVLLGSFPWTSLGQDGFPDPEDLQLDVTSPRLQICIRPVANPKYDRWRSSASLIADVQVEFDVHNSTESEQSLRWYPISIPGLWPDDLNTSRVSVEVDGDPTPATVQTSRQELGLSPDKLLNHGLGYLPSSGLRLTSTPSVHNRELYQPAIDAWLSEPDDKLARLRQEHSQLEEFGSSHAIRSDIEDVLKEILIDPHKLNVALNAAEGTDASSLSTFNLLRLMPEVDARFRLTHPKSKEPYVSLLNPYSLQFAAREEAWRQQVDEWLMGYPDLEELLPRYREKVQAERRRWKLHREIEEHLVSHRNLARAQAASMVFVALANGIPSESLIERISPSVHQTLVDQAAENRSRYAQHGFRFTALNPLTMRLDSTLRSSFPYHGKRQTPSSWQSIRPLSSGAKLFQWPALVQFVTSVQAGDTRHVEISWSSPMAPLPGVQSLYGSSVPTPYDYAELYCVFPPWLKQQAVAVTIQLPGGLFPICNIDREFVVTHKTDTTTTLTTEATQNVHIVAAAPETWSAHMGWSDDAATILVNRLATHGSFKQQDLAKELRAVPQRTSLKPRPQFEDFLSEKSASPIFERPVLSRKNVIHELLPHELEILASNVSQLATAKLNWKEKAGRWFVFCCAQIDTSRALQELIAIGSEGDEEALHVLELLSQLEIEKSSTLPFVLQHVQTNALSSDRHSKEFSLNSSALRALATYRSHDTANQLISLGLSQPDDWSGFFVIQQVVTAIADLRLPNHFDRLVKLSERLRDNEISNNAALVTLLDVMLESDRRRTVQLVREWVTEFPQHDATFRRILSEEQKRSAVLDSDFLFSLSMLDRVTWERRKLVMERLAAIYQPGDITKVFQSRINDPVDLIRYLGRYGLLDDEYETVEANYLENVEPSRHRMFIAAFAIIGDDRALGHLREMFDQSDASLHGRAAAHSIGALLYGQRQP